ncbi:DUF1285 domain-containing protein [Gynuella sunshinyii]|uniref:DUF1285 domain-containing protein n=1 Tax=Gynuella sunshinyii YC6258 TaxID=1445510 RepID=A0A0C5VY75_9GAMM|nr:DUF1285 domain-containing protein [Gynuella sunshinyii]AJQ95329.1 hypothetical protein YC6258_03293 [Gynuella sunshinyii YC6258]
MKLDDIATHLADHKVPPVHLWHPRHCGEIDIRIDRNGRWFHEGEEILRVALVRLFSSVLWNENGDFYLKTPVEQMKIQVELEPILIVDAEERADGWHFRTQFDEDIRLGAEHPLEMCERNGEQYPRIKVRYDLWGMLERNLFYQLIDLALSVDSEDGHLTELFLVHGDDKWSLGSFENT